MSASFDFPKSDSSFSARQRRLGVLQPLFSLRTTRGWGVGEIGDIARFARWAGSAGISVLQLLPVSELTEGESSPYSAATAFALDPVYLSLDDVEDFVASGGRAGLGAGEATHLDRLATTTAVDWPVVRGLKQRAIERAFAWFEEHEWQTGSARRRELEAFIELHRAWLPDYALFRAVHDVRQRAWWDWPRGLKDRDPAALAAARSEHERAILRRCWVEWQLDRQWTAARQAARSFGVALKGDLPFMVAGDSADVWAHAGQFRLDRRVGTPPDAFSATGQDWGLPAYDWAAMTKAGFPWMNDRAARAGALFDLFRVDHVIGLFRTYSRSVTQPDDAGFSPENEADQIALGNTVLDIFKKHGEVVAEDLGFVPPFLPAALERREIPGYRVLRWEKDADGAFRDPARYPTLSVATTGTHDVEPIATWYEAMDGDERRQLHRLFAGVPAEKSPRDGSAAVFTDEVRDQILTAVMRAESELCVLPFQDLFGQRDRINLPGTVAATNWTVRMPAGLEALEHDGEARTRLRRLAVTTERWQSES